MKGPITLLSVALILPQALAAQSDLPPAPGLGMATPVQTAVLASGPALPGQAAPSGQNPMPNSAPAAASAQDANAQQLLSLAQAEQMAIRNNPRVTVGKLLALAQHQMEREARSAELPTATGAVTAMDANEGSRISAGSLTSSRLLVHAGAGANVTQLIYDFGHTHNLVLSRKLSAQAQDANAQATAEEIVLATDQAFYDALTAQAELDVARQTVNARQTTDTQVGEMTRNKLKSTLDQSFADVDLSQAQLMELDAKNNAESSLAVLDEVLGIDHPATFRLVEDAAEPAPPPQDVDAMIRTALAQRPDLQALNLDTQSQQKFARAEWDQMLPSISAAGTVGTIPVRSGSYYITNWWGAVGGNVNIPIFNGFLYSSQAREAKYRAQAAAENSRDLRDRIVRDVRTSWLQASNNWQRMAVTAQLVKQANLAFSLAQTRYKLGLSSIVELSQAQLQQTSAQIQDTAARYQYRLSLSTLNYEMGVAP
ncbi:MAG TPA: TolC family protein [Acidobacteriaceae bacterium]